MGFIKHNLHKTTKMPEVYFTPTTILVVSTLFQYNPNIYTKDNKYNFSDYRFKVALSEIF